MSPRLGSSAQVLVGSNATLLMSRSGALALAARFGGFTRGGVQRGRGAWGGTLRPTVT